jgi:hypothetical protein
MIRLLACAALLSGCASPAPCDGKGGLCLNVTVTGAAAPLDLLEVDVTLPTGDVIRGDSAAGLAPIVPPVEFALILPAATAGEVGVEVLGEVGGSAVSSGSGRVVVPPSGQSLTVALSAGAPDGGAPDGADLGAPDAAPDQGGHTLSFAQAVNYPAGVQPYLAGIADLDGDGQSDLTVADYRAGLNVLRGSKSGFAAPVGFPAGGGPDFLAMADFNRDGRLDVAVADYDSGQAGILLGNGAGGFGAITTYPVVPLPYGTVAADFNEDGWPDIAVGGGMSGNVSILLSDGKGGFLPQAIVAAGGATAQVGPMAVDDFDRDGHLDLAAPNFSTVAVFRGTGKGTFGAATMFAAGNGPSSLALADFNRDGHLDIVVTNYYGYNVSVLLWQNATNLFGPSLDTQVNSAGVTPGMVATADFDGDGIPDAAVLNKNNVRVFLGQPNGGLKGAATLMADLGPTGITAGDIDRDQRPDLAVTCVTTGKVSVLYNTSQ